MCIVIHIEIIVTRKVSFYSCPQVIIQDIKPLFFSKLVLLFTLQSAPTPWYVLIFWSFSSYSQGKYSPADRIYHFSKYKPKVISNDNLTFREHNFKCPICFMCTPFHMIYMICHLDPYLFFTYRSSVTIKFKTTPNCFNDTHGCFSS